MTISIGVTPAPLKPGSLADSGFKDSVSGVAGEALDFGDLVRVAGDGTVTKVAADADIDTYICGVVLLDQTLASGAGVAVGEPVSVLTSGRVAVAATLTGGSAITTNGDGAIGQGGATVLDLCRVYDANVVDIRAPLKSV